MVIGGMAMPLAMSGGFAVVGHGRETKSTVKSTVFLGCPVWFVNWTENLFLGRRNVPYPYFFNFSQFFNFLRTFFSYGLWFMVS